MSASKRSTRKSAPKSRAAHRFHSSNCSQVLGNLPSFFSRLMDTLFAPYLWQFVLNYLDDSIVYTSCGHSHKEGEACTMCEEFHLKHLQQFRQFAMSCPVILGGAFHPHSSSHFTSSSAGIQVLKHASGPCSASMSSL